jgi:hypothetical protein
MMPKVLLISLVAVMARAHVLELAAERGRDAQDSADNLIDKMLDRTQRSSEAAEGLDRTTLGKTSQLARVSGRTDGGNGGLIYHGMRGSTSFKVPLRLQQRTLALRVAQSDSKSGQPAREGPSIQDFFRKISDTFPVVRSIGVETAVEETSQPEPMSVKVDRASKPQGEECDPTFEVKVTLEPAVAAEIHWESRPVVVLDANSRPVGSRPAVAVGSVAEDSEAYRRGIRPGMVVKASEMPELRDIREGDSYIDAFLDARKLIDAIRGASYPMTLDMGLDCFGARLALA